MLLVYSLASPDRVVNSGVLGNFSDDEEDDCGDDLTKAERLEWKAKQEDLSNKRKGEITLFVVHCTLKDVILFCVLFMKL